MTYAIASRLAASTVVAFWLVSPPYATAEAQGLARRVDTASGNAQFHFAGRDGVCGDGRTFIRADNDYWMGSFNEMTRASACEPGPVRVLVVRADREPIRLETFVGPLSPDASATDLGAVPAREAAAYLMQLATTGEGRVARESMSAAALADSATITRDLLAIVRDQSKSRELRRSALGWIVRRRGEPGELPGDEVVRLVVALARDANENSSNRQNAVSLLGRFDRGEGIPTLIELAGSGEDAWLAKQAVESLARSGDPRARRALRTLVTAADTPEETRVAAIAGLANDYSTAKDADLVRDAYPRLTSDRSRDAAIAASANIGGPTTRSWLVSLVKNRDQALRQRKKAAEQIDRAGVPGRDVASLYDQVDDGELRGVLIEELSQSRTKESTAKLLSIAKDDPQVSLRRRAIAALGRVDDPAVRTALKGMVEK